MSHARHYGVTSAREYLLDGHPLTQVEALILFGAQDLTKLISNLRTEQYQVHRGTITFAAAIDRLRGHATLEPPIDLPVRAIRLTEYRVAV